MAILKKDFLSEELLPVLNQNKIDDCFVVQSAQSEKENTLQLENTEKYHFIKGVVGWVDIQAHRKEERLAYYSQFKK